jgi:Na+-transporting NADH:ubiquinone oxidoreductase subunit C
MNKESNAYIILFSVIMVVVMGVSLAIVAQLTKEPYEANVKKEKMQNILTSVNITVDRDSAPDLFEKYIVSSAVYKADGSILDNADSKIDESMAFSTDLAAELKKPEADQVFPLFTFKKDGKTLFIIPMRGKGLWGPVWGYISIDKDMNTLTGASFAHAGETPGLGAEISTTMFQQQFLGKKMNDDAGTFVSVEVAKKGKYASDFPHAVDAISGGTITTNGVNDMVKKYLQAYKNYVVKNNLLNPVVEAVMPMDSLAVDSLAAVDSLTLVTNIK